MIVWIIAGFSFGILLRSFIAVPWVIAMSVVITIFPILVVMSIRPPARRSAGRRIVFILLFIVSASLGVLRYDWNDAGSRSAELDNAVNQTVRIRGVIADEPDERVRSVRLVIEARELFASGAWRKIQSGSVLATVGRFPEFSYGDAVELYGELKTPDNFPGFDYRAYLAKDGVWWEMYFPRVESQGVDPTAWSWFRRELFALKRAYLGHLAEVLPEPQSALIGGLTVGARKAMPQSVLDDFRAAGLLHVLVLSGYNVTIVARAIAGLAPAFIPYFLRLGAGLAGIAVFALFAGASATVVRASLMAALLYVAGISGRVYQAKIALVAAGILMLALNPKLLRFDLSFQLSFLATAGLLWIAPRIERVTRWFPQKFGIREYATATLSAQIAVTPLLLHSMGTVSLVALPANILVLMTVPASMAIGALAGVLGFIHVWLALPFAWFAWALASYELFVVHLFARIPFAQIAVPFTPVLIGAAILGAILTYRYFYSIHREGKRVPS